MQKRVYVHTNYNVATRELFTAYNLYVSQQQQMRKELIPSQLCVFKGYRYILHSSTSPALWIWRIRLSSTLNHRLELTLGIDWWEKKIGTRFCHSITKNTTSKLFLTKRLIWRCKLYHWREYYLAEVLEHHLLDFCCKISSEYLTVTIIFFIKRIKNNLKLKYYCFRDVIYIYI